MEEHVVDSGSKKAVFLSPAPFPPLAPVSPTQGPVLTPPGAKADDLHLKELAHTLPKPSIDTGYSTGGSTTASGEVLIESTPTPPPPRPPPPPAVPAAPVVPHVEDADQPVVRKRVDRKKMTDEEVFLELNTIINHKDNPHEKYDMSKKLGAGTLEFYSYLFYHVHTKYTL